MRTARELAGEVITLMTLTRARTAEEEKRLADLCSAFGDREESARALLRAAMKGEPDALREIDRRWG